MKLKAIIAIVALVFSSACNEVSKSKTERAGEPDVHNVESSNESMNLAIEKANDNFGDFEKAIASENSDYANFSIKQKFDTEDGGGEHIWIQDIKLVDANYVGILGNDPIYIKNIALGDTVTIDKNNLSDWMYLDNGIVRGAYTVRVFRDEMSEEERVQFDIESGLLFE